MRFSTVGLALAFGCGFAHAQLLTDADREAVLERLDALKAAAALQTDSRFRSAISAFSSAMSSEDAAMELYLKCIEKVDFEDQKKKPVEFREWKRAQEEKLSKQSLKLALRHQLRWLVLTLQASSENSNRPKLIPAAQQAVDDIFRNLETIKDQQDVIRQQVTQTYFARAYGLNGLKVQDWPLSPIDLGNLYEQLVLPPLRNSSRLATLRENWQKRIRQEGEIQEFWTGGNQGGVKKDDRFGTPATVERSPEFEKFILETPAEAPMADGDGSFQSRRSDRRGWANARAS